MRHKGKETDAQHGERSEGVKKKLHEETSLGKEKMKEILQKAGERDAFWDKYLRVTADFDNAQKRWDRERQELLRLANFSLLRELIVTVDELEQAIRIVKEHGNTKEIIQGLEMTHKNLLSILRKQGVEQIQTEGKKFDPHLHEIVGQKQTDEDEHIIVEEAQKGYLLSNKLLRTAKVIINVKVPTPNEEKDGEEEINTRGES